MRHAVIIALLSAGIVQCTEQEPGVLSGDIVGRIGYVEANYINSVDSLGDVSVTLVGADGSTRSVTTDGGGNYRFDNVLAGNYDLTFDYQGTNGQFTPYAPRVMKVTHLGGGITLPQHVYLAEVPAYATTIESFSWFGDTLELHFSMAMAGADEYAFVLYLDDEQSVSSQNFNLDIETQFLDPEFETHGAITEGKLRVFFYEPPQSAYAMLYPISIFSRTVMGSPSNVMPIPR